MVGVGAEGAGVSGVVGIAVEVKNEPPALALRITEASESRLVTVVVIVNHAVAVEAGQVVGPAQTAGQPAAARGQATSGVASALGQGGEVGRAFAALANDIHDGGHRVRS